MDRTGTVEVLPESVARRIAAGEVIERPAGVVRELLDNSLDAGATRVAVEITAGGIDRIRVTDNGSGMPPEDLARSILPHATSKIRSIQDLLEIRTLGFRGEALSSIGAVSRMSIVSAPADGVSHQIVVHAGTPEGPRPHPGAPGTSVDVADLFFNVPARRQFLKRATAEAAVVNSVFRDKALAFPGVEFSLAGGSGVASLPAGTQVERIVSAYPSRTEPARLHELRATGDGFRATIVAGEPGFPRKDRKNIQVFANQRRIWEYALVQAIEYAYRDYLHGGLYPTAFLFLEIEPSLVDFNIHPAKREARFRTLPDIHRRIVAALGEFLRVFDRKSVLTGPGLPFGAPHPGGNSAPEAGSSNPPGGETRSRPDPPFRREDWSPGNRPVRYEDAVHQAPRRKGADQPAGFDLSRTLSVGEEPERGYRYLGQIMNLFLVVEVADHLYLVDQHAAHERIIYDRLRQGAGGQELLFPVRVEANAEEATVLRRNRDALRAMGIELEERDGGWELVTVPALGNLEAEGVAALLMETLDRPADFERELYASLSCRAAVMDGDVLTRETALTIIDGVIGLENARCPHGRPVWVSWDVEQLKQFVGRT